jgi:transposase-like protein
MMVLIKCPDCAKTYTVNISTFNVGSTPLLLIDEQAVFDSTNSECPFCKKETHVTLSVELFD